MEGCKEELSAFDSYDESLLIETDTSAEGGYAAADDIIEKFPEITAVICFSDITALGLYKRLNEKGMRSRKIFPLLDLMEFILLTT